MAHVVNCTGPRNGPRRTAPSLEMAHAIALGREGQKRSRKSQTQSNSRYSMARVARQPLRRGLLIILGKPGPHTDPPAFREGSLGVNEDNNM